MITENLKHLIEVGYKAECNKLKALVMYRIETSSLEIFNDLFENNRSSIEEYCSKNNIDLGSILLRDEKSIKSLIALNIVEASIKTQMYLKRDFDDEIKQLNISPIRITNGAENAPWLKVFKSPNNLQWFSKNSSKVIEALEQEHENQPAFEVIVKTVAQIKDNWCDPQSLVPDLELYRDIMDWEVGPICNELLVKASGY